MEVIIIATIEFRDMSEVCNAENIPAPLSDTRYVVIKQPVGMTYLEMCFSAW
jgi:hypothetical protein